MLNVFLYFTFRPVLMDTVCISEKIIFNDLDKKSEHFLRKLLLKDVEYDILLQ